MMPECAGRWRKLMMPPDIDRVTALLWDAAHEEILPRFRALPAVDVYEKSPGELVTAADYEAESLITRRLAEITPGIPVVGEEICASRPDLLEALVDAPAAWLVDPLDGTANFVGGSDDWAVMAALVHAGDTAAAWILRPTQERVYVAERGSGAWRDGVRLNSTDASGDPGRLCGALFTRFLDDQTRRAVDLSARRFAAIGPGCGCAGIEYPMIAEGVHQFVYFHRILPWDHAPGALLLQESGATAQRLDGRRYRPGGGGTGLLAAAGPECWATVRRALPL